LSVGVPYAKLTSESDTVNDLNARAGVSVGCGKRYGKWFAAEIKYSQISFPEEKYNDSYPASFSSELELTEIMLGYQIIINRYWAFKMGYNYAQFTRKFNEADLTPAQSEAIQYDKTFQSF